MNGETFHKALAGEENQELGAALFPTSEEIDLLDAWLKRGTSQCRGVVCRPSPCGPGIQQIVTAPTGN